MKQVASIFKKDEKISQALKIEIIYSINHLPLGFILRKELTNQLLNAICQIN